MLRSALVILILYLTACGGSGDLPPVETNTNSSALTGTVEGTVFMSSGVTNAQVSIYEFDNGEKGKRLATTMTLGDGSFLTHLKSLTRPILIESTGGQYRESSSGVTVEIKDTQRLQFVAYYDEGMELSSISITPFSHLSKALLEHRTQQGVALSQALEGANDDLDQLFSVDVSKLMPRDISLINSDVVSMEQYRFGFLLAGLSSLSQFISEANGDATHESYTSIELTQVFYNDLLSDGKLDGVGFNQAQDQLLPLAFGMYALNSETYRVDLPQHLLSMTIHSENKTFLNVEDLLEYALALINNESGVLDPVGNVASDIALYNLTPEGIYHNGTFEFSVLVNKPDLVDSISFDIDGIPLGQAADNAAPKISIDTLSYAEGEHKIGVTVEDLLGNTLFKDYVVNFDNSSPFVNVLSDTVTRLAEISLSGDYGDNGSGVRAISIQGAETSLGAGNSWQTTIALSEGVNTVPITLLDWAGNEYIFNATVIRDVDAPTIGLLSEQSFVRFSEGDGSFTQDVPALTNPTPIYIATNKTDLDGLTLDREILEDEEILYFAFEANDPAIAGAEDYDAAVTLSMKYERNGTEYVSERTLTPVEGQYLVPLVGTYFGDTWLTALPSDLNSLILEAKDPVGNVSELSLDFQLDFVVASPTVAASDEFAEFISGVEFADRQSLYGNEYTIMTYTFTNETDSAFYMSLGDVGYQTAEQTVETLVREHLVRLETQTLWRLGFIPNVQRLCPDSGTGAIAEDIVFDSEGFFYEFDGSEYVKLEPPVSGDLVYDFDGTKFDRRRPVDAQGEITQVFTDTPVAPASTDWLPGPMINDEYAEITVAYIDTLSRGVMTYEFDFMFGSEPAVIRNLVKTPDGGEPIICEDVTLFFEMESYAYVSEEGYPKNKLTMGGDNEGIEQVSFQVYNRTIDQLVADYNDTGWFKVPAGDEIVITKRVTLPVFTVFNDLDVASPDTFSSYDPMSYDKSITWSLDNSLTMSLVHDTGDEDSILAMTPATVEVELGGGVYSVTR